MLFIYSHDVKTRGLIWKTVPEIHSKCLRSYNLGSLPKPTNIISKTGGMFASGQFPYYKFKSMCFSRTSHPVHTYTQPLAVNAEHFMNAAA